MKIYTYSQARQHLAELLDDAQTQEVIIRRRDGTVFSVKCKKRKKSPFNVKGIDSAVTSGDIVRAVRESRALTNGSKGRR